MQEKHHKQSFNLYYDCCKKMVVEPHLRQLLSLFQHPKMLKIKAQKIKPIRSQGKKKNKKKLQKCYRKKKKKKEMSAFVRKQMKLMGEQRGLCSSENSPTC